MLNPPAATICSSDNSIPKIQKRHSYREWSRTLAIELVMTRLSAMPCDPEAAIT